MSESKPRRKLAAILAADVVGFSKKMGENEDRTLRNLKACRTLTDESIEAHHGRVFGSAGDSVIAEFASPVDAIVAAVEFQRNLRDRNLNITPEDQMEFRVGLNLGDVIVEGDNLYGDGVNVAARLEPLAEPGGICVSGKFHDEVRRKLDLGFVSKGAQEMKNIDEPVHTFNVLLGHETEEVSQISSSAPSAAAAVRQPSANEKPRLIVLPFNNLSNVEDNDFLVDGIVEDLITEFSRINSIEVISRNTAFSLKGKEIENTKIAAEFGIDFIATGSIRSSGNRIRISVDLTDPVTGSSIWSERYDGTMDDVFEVQDEIVRKVIVALVGKLEMAGLERAKRKPTENLTSYEYLLRGRDYHHKFSKEGVLSAIEMLDKSIEADPNNAQAYAWRACSLGQGLGRGYLEGDQETHFQKLQSLIQKALELDENDLECNRILCELNKLFEDFEQSEFYGKKAYDMNSNDPRVVCAYGELLVLTNRADEGTDLLIKAYELDPVGMGASNADKRLGDVMFGAYVKGDFQQCLEYDKKIGKKQPIAWITKIASLESLNQSQEKEAELKKFEDAYPEIVLGEEIDKLHFQDASAKQTLKDLVA
ncbi:adenylate/guanylate cyclase domain-containing protein [Deltaproteobacteria bacterium]|nr:adenylate/guanylate cyclase domain-containing protein [Deltaproteobacteria bacterium]